MLLATLLRPLIRDGALTLIDAEGRTHRFGRASMPAEVVVRLADRSLHRRLCTSPALTLGEAYVDGTLTVERGGIDALCDLLARNRAALLGAPLLRQEQARGWIEERLGRGEEEPPEVPDELCDLLLGWDRQTSSAYFADPRMTLDEAQQAKKHHLASKLLLRPGQKVLEIGSGWGGLALHLADAEHVEVTGLTRSGAELAVARRRAAEAELDGRVTFHQRSFQEERGRYDRVVSVGLVEHLTAARREALFARIREVMAEDGVAVVHAVGRAGGPLPTHPWVRRHALPTARLPALSEVLAAAERAGLLAMDVEILRLHAAETLRCWRRRLGASWEALAAERGAAFCRRWELLLALAEAGFRCGALMVFELQLGRRHDAAPLTRDYLYERAAASSERVGLAA
jgi:cyclopropane-fatty-acyl-phospholipid synthase